MENNPLDQLPPETRQRIENALQAFGGGVPPQNVFVSQYPGAATPGYVPPQTGQHAEDHPGALGGGTFPGMNQIFSGQFTMGQKNRTGESQAWAHWEYGPYEWSLFNKIDWLPVRNRSQRTLIMSPVICLVIIGALLAVLLVGFQVPIPATFAIVLTSAILLLTALMFVMISAANSGKGAKARYQARQNQAEPHRVTFSRQGIWEAGTFFPFNSAGLELESVKLTANPAVLHFKMLKFNSDGSWTGTAQKIHVPVPRGSEGEAEHLRQRYYAEGIKTWKKPYNPPEPV
jgi:hypothetical protein